MKKKLIRLTESDLHRIVENSVKRIIREYKWEINNDSRGLDTNFYNTGIEGFDDEDDLDDDEGYKPLDGNLSFDNESDFYTSSEIDDKFDDSEYFEGKGASDSKNFDNKFERLGNEMEFETNNEFYKNPQKEINNRLKRIKKGESIENVFNVCSKPSNKVYTIEFNGKFNCIDVNTGKLLSNEWFEDMTYDFKYVYGLSRTSSKIIASI